VTRHTPTALYVKANTISALMKVKIVAYASLTLRKGSVWEERKAVNLNLNIPDGRIVSRVQVELTTVKLCIHETESPTVDFEFSDPSSNDPHPLVSTVFLSDNCGCNICPTSEDGLDWSDAEEKQWRGSKDFVLDVKFEGINSTLCLKTLTIKFYFISESFRCSM
jgi:hypothetical protein